MMSGMKNMPLLPPFLEVQLMLGEKNLFVR